MDHTGSRYEGTMVNGRMEGEGKYFFPNGNVYVGEFLDGAFHGEGTIYFPDKGKFCATWDHGTAIDGVYSFRDGLVYQPTPVHAPISLTTDPWPYCKDQDRRYHTEHLNGLQPAGQSQLVDVEPVRDIPGGCYDTGDGYFNPDVGLIYTYSGHFLRAPDLDELAWIPAHCRRGAGTAPPPDKATHRGHGGDLPPLTHKDAQLPGSGRGAAADGAGSASGAAQPAAAGKHGSAASGGGDAGAGGGGGGKSAPRNVKRPKARRARDPAAVLGLLRDCARGAEGPQFLGLFEDGSEMVVAAGLLSALQAVAMAARGERRKQLTAELQRICIEFECQQDNVPRHVAKGTTGLTEIAKVRLFSDYSSRNVGALASDVLRVLGTCAPLPHSGDRAAELRVSGTRATAFCDGRALRFVTCEFNTWVLVPDLSFLALWNPAAGAADENAPAGPGRGQGR